MEKTAAVGSTPVPPYESNPQYQPQPTPGSHGQAPPQPLMHQDSYQITQVPSPQPQYQHQPMNGPGSPPPPFKQEGSYYGGSPAHQPQQQVPGQQPMQQQPLQSPPLQPPPLQQQQSQYRNAVPLGSLTDASAPVDCPTCGNRALTRVNFEAGQTTLAWAAIICFWTCLGCIPYLINGLKDVSHHCGHCGVKLATWHRSGRTVVHAHH